MAVFNIHETRTHFSRLIERVLNGEEIIIAKAGKPVARIVAIVDDMSPRVPGTDKGKVIIHADFDSPLPELVIQSNEEDGWLVTKKERHLA